MSTTVTAQESPEAQIKARPLGFGAATIAFIAMVALQLAGTALIAVVFAAAFGLLSDFFAPALEQTGRALGLG